MNNNNKEKFIIKLVKVLGEILLTNRAHLFARYIWLKYRGNLEKEMFYVTKLVKGSGRFLDIGANRGTWSYYMKDKFIKIECFEPLAKELNKLVSLGLMNIRIHDVALSNKKGEKKLYLPTFNGVAEPSLASLEIRNGKYEERLVEVKTLDDFKFDDVELIKIDVEGHEKFIILGAIKTIKKCLPIMVVEIEQRHIQCDISDVFASITDLNYNGYFLKSDQLTPLKEFSLETHQHERYHKKRHLDKSDLDQYTYNFIFIPDTRKIKAE